MDLAMKGIAQMTSRNCFNNDTKNYVIKINYIKVEIDYTSMNYKCKLCKERYIRLNLTVMKDY